MNQVEDLKGAANLPFLGPHTLPILERHPESNDVAICGTASLYQRDTRTFLVTAAHVAESLEEAPERVFIPTKRGREGGLQPFGAHRIFADKRDTRDVAVVLLEDSATIDNLTTQWSCITPDMVAAPDHGEWFAVYGYPADKTARTGKEIRSTSVCIGARRFTGQPIEVRYPVDPDGELLLEAWEEALPLSLEAKTRDAPQGISGCVVWGIRRAQPLIWTPEADLKVVAIETGVISTTWMRCTLWKAVDDLIAGVV